MEILDSLGGALLVFLARLIDVSIGTVRVMYTVRGQRRTAALLGLVESGVFIFAVSSVLAAGTQDYVKMAGYALGFSCGTLLGVTVERLIASGFILIRIISRSNAGQITQALRESDYAVTVLTGEGRDGPVKILFVVIPRRYEGEVQSIIQKQDDDAFMTIEPVGRTLGGYGLGGMAGVK